jgi:hypothetical protein
MPRVLMPGETDATVAAEKQEAFAMIQQTMEEIMARHNTAFLNSFRQMMVGVFVPSVDKHFEQVNRVLLLMANHLVKTQVLRRLSKV